MGSISFVRVRFKRLFANRRLGTPVSRPVLRVTPARSRHRHAVRSKQDEAYFFNFDLAVPGEPSSADLSVTPAAGVTQCSTVGTGVTASPVEAQATVEEDTSESESTSGASSTAVPAGGMRTAVAALGSMVAVIAAARH